MKEVIKYMVTKKKKKNNLKKNFTKKKKKKFTKKKNLVLERRGTGFASQRKDDERWHATDLVEDVAATIEYIAKKNSKMFILAHSCGSGKQKIIFNIFIFFFLFLFLFSIYLFIFFFF